MLTEQENAIVADLFVELERAIGNRVDSRDAYQSFKHAYLAFGGMHGAYVNGFASVMGDAKRTAWTHNMRVYLEGEGVTLPPIEH
jgi:hypothetical protein